MKHALAADAAGIGLRAPHLRDLLETRPALDFVEVHSENYFHDGGPALAGLLRVREHNPVSLHGVGLSLASGDTDSAPMIAGHLESLARLVQRVEPALVSEHLCWGAFGGRHFNDLLPLPYTDEALSLVAGRIERVQERLKRRILVENISAYVRFADSPMSECEFLAALVARSGCGLLLDVNNLYVNACNFDFDPRAELARLPREAIGEIHLAGHSITELCRIDTHDAPVCEEVWSLYADALQRFGPRPTLIERDAKLPPLSVLVAERDRAAQAMAGCAQEAA
ncbi:DUF692 domain-containing protein [Niveibacterium sp. SC-1]|uniref:MNIO family bufferin maturase n=1 Tax=Niveibacterium sp. SC-1 TaxID=3135646 RepID=UPI00311D5C55